MRSTAIPKAEKNPKKSQLLESSDRVKGALCQKIDKEKLKVKIIHIILKKYDT